MTELLTVSNILFVIGLIGTLFTVYNSFKDPQIKSDKEDIKINERMTNIEKSVIEIREKHLTGVESDIKALNVTIQDLAKTVVRLSTIIDERIPKASTNSK